MRVYRGTLVADITCDPSLGDESTIPRILGETVKEGADYRALSSVSIFQVSYFILTAAEKKRGHIGPPSPSPYTHPHQRLHLQHLPAADLTLTNPPHR